MVPTMTNSEPMTPTSVGLSPELRRRLDVAAQRLQRKRAEVIRFAIEAYLDTLVPATPTPPVGAADPERGSGATQGRTRRRK